MGVGGGSGSGSGSIDVAPLRSGDPRGVGAYEFLGRLGAGGMGLVCLARGPDGRLAAVKLVHEDIAADPAYRRRFAREVRAAAALPARFTPAILAADAQAPQPWYAAEFVDGPTLGQVVRREGPLAERPLRALAAGLAEAVAAFETAGLVHRDLKPDNILLSPTGPKIIDFGIARGENDSVLTRAGSVVGSPGYMSPEQIAGERATTASDIFSLGAVLAYAAQAHGAFGDGTIESRLYRTRYSEPDIARLPPQLRETVTACLAKQPAARPTPQDLIHRWSVRTDELDTLIQLTQPLPKPPTAPRFYGESTPGDGHHAAPPTSLPGAGSPIGIGGSAESSGTFGLVSPSGAAPGSLPRAGGAIAPGSFPGAGSPIGGSGSVAPGSFPGAASPIGIGGSAATGGNFGAVSPLGPTSTPTLALTSATSLSRIPFDARRWWHQPVGADRLPRFEGTRDLLAALAGGMVLALPTYLRPGVVSTVLFAATGLAVGLLLGVRRCLLGLTFFGAVAPPGHLMVASARLSAAVSGPRIPLVCEAAVFLFSAAGVARVGGIRKRPVLCFAVAFAGYIAGQAVALAWVAGRTGVDFPSVWRSGADGLLVYRDAGIAAVCACALGFLALIGSTQEAVGVDGPYRATGEIR